jgi:hypothetical protein
MDPPLFHLAPSGYASLLTLRISRSLFPNVGHRARTDHRAQSDEWTLSASTRIALSLALQMRPVPCALSALRA